MNTNARVPMAGAAVAERSTLQDRIDIEDVICAQTLYIDLMEWDKVLACYTQDAQLFFSATFGTGFDGVALAEHYEHVRALLEGFDATQHQMTNFEFRIDGDTAKVRCLGRATHVLGQEAWVSSSIYYYHLQRTPHGWLISRKGNTKLFQQNSELMEKARERVRQGIIRPERVSPSWFR